MLAILAAVNAVVIAWSTVLDARRQSALTRALGTTPQQLTAGLCAAQMVPALPGAIAGIPAGIGLYAALSHGGGAGPIAPPLWSLLAVAAGTLIVVAGLTAVPARIGARYSIAEILQSEAA